MTEEDAGLLAQVIPVFALAGMIEIRSALRSLKVQMRAASKTPPDNPLKETAAATASLFYATILGYALIVLAAGETFVILTSLSIQFSEVFTASGDGPILLSLFVALNAILIAPHVQLVVHSAQIRIENSLRRMEMGLRADTRARILGRVITNSALSAIIPVFGVYLLLFRFVN